MISKHVMSEFSVEGPFSPLSFPSILVTDLDMLSDRGDCSNSIEACILFHPYFSPSDCPAVH